LFRPRRSVVSQCASEHLAVRDEPCALAAVPVPRCEVPSASCGRNHAVLIGEHGVNGSDPADIPP
jgi:hypothetical protein